MADRNEFLNDLEVYCSAKEHKGMVLDLIRVYGAKATLKNVLDSINYQLDKYENLLFMHNLLETKGVAGAVLSSLSDLKETE